MGLLARQRSLGWWGERERVGPSQTQPSPSSIDSINELGCREGGVGGTGPACGPWSVSDGAATIAHLGVGRGWVLGICPGAIRERIGARGEGGKGH